MNNTKPLRHFLILLAASAALPANPAFADDNILAAKGLVAIYDNWDVGGAQMDVKEGADASYSVKLSGITDVAYFDKGLTVTFPPGEDVRWDDFAAVRAAIRTDIPAEFVKFIIQQADGAHWVASLPFEGTGRNAVYVAPKDAFQYGWGGEENRERSGTIVRLYISLFSGEKFVGNKEVEFSRLALVNDIASAAVENRPAIWDFSAAQDGDNLGIRDASGFESFKVSGGALRAKMGADYAYTAPIATGVDAAAMKNFEITMGANGPSADLTLVVYFIPEGETDFSEQAKVVQKVTASTRPKAHRIKMDAVPAWKGRIEKFRIDVSAAPGTELEISKIEFQ